MQSKLAIKCILSYVVRLSDMIKNMGFIIKYIYIQIPASYSSTYCVTLSSLLFLSLSFLIFKMG